MFVKLDYMRFFKMRTFLEVLAAIWVNLTSGWFGLLLVAPGFFGVASIEEYTKSLTINLPLGIVSLVFTLYLTERSKKL